MSQPSITTADLVIAQMSSSKPTDRTTTALTDDTPATPDELPLFEPYESPAGGWSARVSGWTSTNTMVAELVGNWATSQGMALVPLLNADAPMLPVD
jgi:hypothetical protein